MQITIDVTQEDIDKHLVKDDEYNGTCNSCQVARALTRTLNVGISCSTGYRTTNSATQLGRLPHGVKEISMLEVFNDRPFSFQLEVPKELVKYCED